MGNFYTNFTILGVDAEEVITAARELRRRAYVVQAAPGLVVLYDEACDEQDTAEIKRLGCALSARLPGPVLACLNHDDDHLLLSVFTRGTRRGRYKSWRHAPAFAWTLARVRGGVLAYPLIVVVLGWPVVPFQFWRHSALVRLLSLPRPAVGYGFRYLARGEIPAGLSKEDIKHA